jgi:hypothetical protein
MRRTLGLVYGQLSDLRGEFGQQHGPQHLRGRDSANQITDWLRTCAFSVHTERLEGSTADLHAAFVADWTAKERAAVPHRQRSADLSGSTVPQVPSPAIKLNSFRAGLLIVARCWPFLERVTRARWRVDFPALRALPASDPRLAGAIGTPMAFKEEL